MVSNDDLGQGASTKKAIRLVRPSVVVLCGPVACGKSTFAARHFRPTQVVSSDRARALVCDDERDQRFQTQAFALLHFIIEQRLSINRLCVVDSTALTQPARKSLLDLARRYRVPCVVFLFDVPFETCLARDQSRERSVGRVVVERQYQFFEQVKSSIRQEGFDQVVELRDEDGEKVQIEIVFRPVPRMTVPSDARRFAPRFSQASPGGQGFARGLDASFQGRGPQPATRVGQPKSSSMASHPARPSIASQSVRPPILLVPDR